MNRFIETILAQRLILLVLGIGVIVAGAFAYRSLPVDAFPDVTPTLVQVFTETEGLAPEDVERYVTYPVEVAMNGLPDLAEVRSTSNFGLSVVNVYFEDGTDIYFARQLVNERLQVAAEEIPQGFGEPEMGPITTGLGQILFYYLKDETGTYSLEELRELQDWVVKFNLQTVHGVTEVLSLGGYVKQFQVVIEPQALLRYDLTIADVLDIVEANNANVGAQFIVQNSEQYVVRSIGLAEDIADLENIVVKTVDGTPVYLRDIAEVMIGGEVRQGLATHDGKGEVVAGLVLKLIGTNTSSVIERVKTELAKIQTALPEGVKIVPYYDQSALVGQAVGTVTNALLQGIALVALVIFAFMGGIRPSIVVALSIPFSIGFAFIMMQLLGISANLMSLGGLAIAIGMMVDAAIVIVENVDRVIHDPDTKGSRRELVARACAEVLRPVLFAIAIIIIVFLPLFMLQGVEGKTFRPLALTVSLAMLGSLIFALLIAPALSEIIMRRRSSGGSIEEAGILRALIALYRPMVAFLVKARWLAAGLAAVLVVIGALAFPMLGSEFTPALKEGDLLVRLTMAPSISLDEAKETTTRFERRLMKEFPQVERIVSRVGRGEVGAHADPVNNAESFVGLKPESEWPEDIAYDDLIAKMAEAFEDFPGVQFNFTQPIAAATDELLTGTKAELAVKIFGPDSEELRRIASEVRGVVSDMEGAADVQMDQVIGTPQLRIRIDREAVARYGLNVDDVQEVVSTAVGGSAAGQILEGVRRFDILLRYPEDRRDTEEAIRRIVLQTPAGPLVSLDQVTEIDSIVGPRQITREDSQRFITVQANVRGRDIGSFVAEGEERIAEEVDLPPGYLVNWGGQFELQQEANQRLAIVVPVTLGLIMLLLFVNFGSLKSAGLIMLNIPLALVGGILGLLMTGQNLSVPASVGFIALFGIALENGMVLVTYLNRLVADGLDVDEASIQGACLRVRPVLMTAATTALGLIPLLYATGAGSEVQKPLATVVVGGLVTSTILTLLVIPALYKWFAPSTEDTSEKEESAI
ncbi:efflux RND transporter permease subunit [Methyloligella solikamskensis]|uniref:Efflux RND transporter permease subunit n=1 Tax=Methyloligella solikamskensis TaxID=1177756 RepID=A0ABW3J8J4_9HYPH